MASIPANPESIREMWALHVQWIGIRAAFRKAPTQSAEHLFLADVHATCRALIRQIKAAQTAEEYAAVIPGIEALYARVPRYMTRSPTPDGIIPNSDSHNQLVQAVGYVRELVANPRAETYISTRMWAIRHITAFSAEVLK